MRLGQDHEVRCVVVSGVSGSGKSTVGSLLASALRWELAEGDAFHPPANIEKMTAGHPLTDQDRTPWLEALGRWIDDHSPADGTVVTCSALRRRYRARLAHGRPWLRFCQIEVPPDLIAERLAGRSGHFMPASLLASQLAALEPLGPTEPGIAVDGSGTPEDVLHAALEGLDSPLVLHR